MPFSISKLFISIYTFITHSIRSKLIAITSLLVMFSINLLVYITLIIFEENITNMIFFLHSKSAKILSDNITNQVIKAEERFEVLIQSKNPDLASKEYKNFILYFHINKKDSIDKGKIVYNKNFITTNEYSEQDLKKFLTNQISTILSICQPNIQIKNISKAFNQPLWLNYYCSDSSLYISILKLNEVSKALLDNNIADSETFLVDSKGKVIFHSDKKILLQELNFSDHPVVRKMYSGSTQNSVLKFTDKNNVKKFGAFERIDNLQLGLVASIPEEIALEGVDTVRWGSLLVMMAVLCLAIIFIYFFSNTISSPIKTLVNATKRIKEGHYDEFIKATTNDEIGILTTSFNSMSQGLREREKLKGALGKFINEEVARQILEGELTLGGKRSEATIFFSDIRQFTAISEKMEPEQVVEFLNQYMTLMVSIIHKTGGVVDKYIGDAIMAVWGAPIKKGNDIENCLNAVLEMRRTLIKFNADRIQKGKFPIIIGCGINTGPVLSGQIGSPERLEYTVIGDAVNLASRVESLSKPFAVDIVITENTYNKIKDKYDVIQMPNATIKGKSEAQKLYTLLGRKGDPKAPKSLDELRKMVGITTKPVVDFGNIAEEQKYEIKQN